MENEERRDFARKLGLAISSKRAALGWTQGELAARMDVTDELISRIERGAVVAPILRLIQFATVLNCTVADFLKEARPALSDRAAEYQAELAEVPAARRDGAHGVVMGVLRLAKARKGEK